MKVTALIYLTVVMIITIGFVTTNSGTEVSNVTLSCQPFSVQIIWHTGSGGNVSLLQHARLLVVLISDFPENTSVSLVTIGAKYDIRLHFRKQEGSNSWRDRILNYKPGISLNHAVSYADIRKALSYHKRNSSKAQLVYLLVNSKTVIRDEENDFEKLRKLKTFVVLAEVKTASKAESWVKLASNEQHFVAWDSRNEDKINKTKNILLARSCQDSLFVCDTDMYWSSDRNRCYACANICSSSCKRQPEYCVHACPCTKDADEKLSCNPYSALIIWYTGSGVDNSFFQQRRLLVVLISDFPENTSVSIVTIGAKEDIRLQFRKQDRITNWIDKILQHVPGTTPNHTLSYTEIQKAIRYHKTNSSEAELVYLLVDGKTVIRGVGNNGVEELRKKKTFVVLCEIQTENRSQTWLKFASNENYFFALDSITGDVNKTKEIILARSCQDSKYVCDTDMYWSSDRKGCNTCTYICSSTCKEQPEYCFNAFFHKYLLDNAGKINKDKDYNSEPLQEHARQVSDNKSCMSWLIIIIACILLSGIVTLVYKQKEKLLSSINYAWRHFMDRRSPFPARYTNDEISELKDH